MTVTIESIWGEIIHDLERHRADKSVELTKRWRDNGNRNH